VRRGLFSHEIFEGDRAAVFRDGDALALQVNCTSEIGGLDVGCGNALAVTLEVAPGASRSPFTKRSALECKLVFLCSPQGGLSVGLRRLGMPHVVCRPDDVTSSGERLAIGLLLCPSLFYRAVVLAESLQPSGLPPH